MRNTTRRCLAVAAVSMLVGCSGSTDPKTETFEFPLVLGNQWIYDYTFVHDYDTDRPDDTTHYLVTMTVARVDTLLPGILVYEIQQDVDIPELPDRRPDVSWYVNLADGMYSFNRRSSAFMSLPSSDLWIPEGHKTPRGSNAPTVAGMHRPAEYASDSPDAATLFDDVRLVLPYPLEVGQHWLHGDSLDALFRVEKEITDYGRVTTPAGDFDCYEVEWKHTPALTGFEEFSDFIAKDGLIRRVIRSRTPETSVTHPGGTGDTLWLISTVELRSFDLK